MSPLFLIRLEQRRWHEEARKLNVAKACSCASRRW